MKPAPRIDQTRREVAGEPLHEGVLGRRTPIGAMG